MKESNGCRVQNEAQLLGRAAGPKHLFVGVGLCHGIGDGGDGSQNRSNLASLLARLLLIASIPKFCGTWCLFLQTQIVAIQSLASAKYCTAIQEWFFSSGFVACSVLSLDQLQRNTSHTCEDSSHNLLQILFLSISLSTELYIHLQQKIQIHPIWMICHCLYAEL